MKEPVIRGAGLAGALAYAAAIGWLYVAQPQNPSQVTGGLAAIVGAYHVDAQAFADGLRFFRKDQFVEARAAFSRADPAERDATTQFYIAYAFYREGWGRVYNDDTLFDRRTRRRRQGRSPWRPSNGRVGATDPDLGYVPGLHELRAELQRGVTREASRSEPTPRLFRTRK